MLSQKNNKRDWIETQIRSLEIKKNALRDQLPTFKIKIDAVQLENVGLRKQLQIVKTQYNIKKKAYEKEQKTLQ